MAGETLIDRLALRPDMTVEEIGAAEVEIAKEVARNAEEHLRELTEIDRQAIDTFFRSPTNGDQNLAADPSNAASVE